jgi:hypothetical protein
VILTARSNSIPIANGVHAFQRRAAAFDGTSLNNYSCKIPWRLIAALRQRSFGHDASL